MTAQDKLAAILFFLSFGPLIIAGLLAMGTWVKKRREDK